MSSSWNKGMQNIREAIILLKEDLNDAEPNDRLEYLSKIMQCIQFTKQSNIGWASLLTDPVMANELSQEALKDIFSKFRKTTIERIENDVDSIDRYMINFVPRDLDADALT